MEFVRLELDERYWLGDPYENGGWRRLTLYHCKRNTVGGSMNWPVAEIDVVDHPPAEYWNAHTEIKISIRNDVKLGKFGIDVDGNKKRLRHPQDIIDDGVVSKIVAKLKENGIASCPLSLYVCIRHIEDFSIEGDLVSDD